MRELRSDGIKRGSGAFPSVGFVAANGCIYKNRTKKPPVCLEFSSTHKVSETCGNINFGVISKQNIFVGGRRRQTGEVILAKIDFLVNATKTPPTGNKRKMLPLHVNAQCS